MTDHAAHSRYGGSVIDRVIECPSSPALCDTVPKRPSSSYADEGTAAHWLAEKCLRQGTHPAAFIGKTVPGFPNITVTLDMSNAVVAYLSVVETERAQTKTSVLYIEEDFVLPISTAADGEVFGRNDGMVYHPETGRLRCFDYKHGAGVRAEARRQLKFYLTGALYKHPEWKIKELVLTVVQPRLRGLEEGEETRDFTWDAAEVFDFVAEVEEAIRISKEMDALTTTDPAFLANVKAGDHCRWCDAAFVCPAREAHALQAATLDFKDVTMVTAAALPEPKSMDLTRLAQVVAALKILTAWGNQCEEYMEGIMLAGHAVPGWKVVDKLGRAAWAEDPAKVTEFAELMFGAPADELMRHTLTTITEAEKILKTYGAKKPDIDAFKLRFTKKDSSGQTIAPESDRRPAVNAAERDFGHVRPITVD